MSVLTGRLAEAVGRSHDALAAYRFAAASSDRPAAAQGRLREIALRYSLGETKKADYIGELENLTTAWRGDETEVEALQTLGAALHRAGPLPRRVPRHARGADRVSELAAHAQHPERSGQDLRRAVPRRQGRRAAGDRCAQPVLRFPRSDPDRPARRRDDPPARRAAGVGRSARSGRRTSAIPGRQPPAGRGARAGGDAACGDLSDEPQAGQGAGGASRHPHRRPLQRNPRAAADDRGARAVRSSAATISRSK